MDWQERVELNPAVLAGKPVIKGTRIAVAFVVSLLARGWTEAAIIENYPQLKPEDIRAALEYSADVLNDESVYSLP
jgi:uncharacterized protein (DUF433 family)